jgi:hypothetical protein
MAGWRKAWLSVLGRGYGGNTGSLQAHLQGHHLSLSLSLSPSSSSSSLAGYKPRGGKHGGGGGHVTGMTLTGCFFAKLAFAFFYVSVLTGGGGPADDASFTSFPATSSPSSSDLLLSWLTSNSSTAPEGKSPTLHPPIPPAVTTASGADDQQRSDARDAATASRRVADNSLASGAGSGQVATPVRVETASSRGSSLQDAGNATVVSDAEHAGNGTRESEPQLETATPVLKWRRKDRADSSPAAVVGDPGDTEAAAGNSTDATIRSRQEITKNAAIEDSAQNATWRAALPSLPEQKGDRDRHPRAARRRHTRRRKEIVLPAAQEAAASEHSDGDGNTAGVNINTALASRNKMPGANASVGPGDNRVLWTSGVQDLVSFAKCDVFNGRWVRDESYGFYPLKSCPLIDDDFNCHKNGRPDSDFLKWRWQPHGCDIPRYIVTLKSYLCDVLQKICS